MSSLILSIDQGTTNTKALLVDRTGAPAFRSSDAVGVSISPEGFVEQDANALWASVQRVMQKAAAFAAQSGSAVEAIAISNQRETALAWDSETHLPLAPAVSWQCARGAAICDRMEHHGDDFRSRTGLPLAPLVSASKWSWLLENNMYVAKAAHAGTLRLGTVDTWLMSQLTAGATHATDLTNASRTGLLNLTSLAWDADLATLFGIPLSALPSLHPSSAQFGFCRGVAEIEGVPIFSAIGDSHAAMFGHGSYGSGTVKATYGTGSSLMALTPDLSPDSPTLARTIAWSIGDSTQFALEGNIAMTGSAIEWTSKFLGLPDAEAVAALAGTVTDAAGVYFVPAMVGLGAPHWDAQARGCISGLSREHNAAHCARAAVDSIAYQVADVFFAMEKAASMHFAELRADGGATRNGSLMQFQADILGCPVHRSKDEELSALGAAWLAGLALGWWESLEELSALPRTHDCFAPGMNDDLRRNRYAAWAEAVERTCMRRERAS